MVGLAVRGARPPGLRAAVCPAPSRPRARPTRAYAVVRRTRRRGGVGARAGGAGWVGPPATRRRRCVRRQRGDQLVAGLEQFVFVEDVVAVEDGAGLVAGQEHGDALALAPSPGQVPAGPPGGAGGRDRPERAVAVRRFRDWGGALGSTDGASADFMSV